MEYHESIDEMKHADRYIERILSGRSSKLTGLGQLNIGEDVEEMLRSDSALELDGAKNLREANWYADSVHDYVSRDIMIEILRDEEGHIDWLETELDLIQKMGLQKLSASTDSRRRLSCSGGRTLPVNKRSSQISRVYHAAERKPRAECDSGYSPALQKL